MDHQGRFRGAALALDVPDDEIDVFAEHLRLSIRLSGSPAGAPVGRFGGSPQLPDGVDWPDTDGSPLPFVFAVDCAALPAVDGLALPAGGSLLFFLDHEKDHLAGGSARVLHTPAGIEITGDSTALGATLVAELPPWFPTEEDLEDDDLSPFQEQLISDVPHLDELSALADELWPRGDGLPSAYVGGYADDEVITSIAEQTLAGREKAGEIVVPVAQWYSAVDREKHRLTREWVSLARFPVDGEYYYGSFVIRGDDLAAGLLERALSVTEFSE
ncbi:DUF1963 domain-containing protein [Actinoplanes sp. NPDC051861]|uniref:DUF1963 domain-containing protein n=1 Tax=Actinoplanes sp. NPDC051861 TaxID=3155170 RepID=UPI003419D93B